MTTPEPGKRLRVVVHIGATKTGSSALQATLHERRDDLASRGVIYPGAGVRAGAHHLLAASIHPDAWRMHTGEVPDDRAAYFAQTVATILAEARREEAHTLVLSSEYFWGSLPASTYKSIADAFPGASFETVAFIRRHDAWATSSYLQAVKSGEQRDFKDWFEGRLAREASPLNYFRVINRWAWYLRAARVHVLRYEDAKANVFAAFCNAVGIDVATDVMLRRVNPSPSTEGLKLLLAINRSEAPEELKAQRRAEVMRTHVADGATAMPLDATTRAAILSGQRTSNRLIVREFLGGEGPLFGRPAGSGRRKAAREPQGH